MGFLRSDGVLPMPLVEYLAKASQFLTILAMAALGLTVDARVVSRVGLSVATVVVLSLATLIAVSTALIHAFALG